MQDYSSICYKNNFLDQVIVRVDFLRFVPTNIIFNENLEKEILKIFQRRGKDQLVRYNSINVVIDEKNSSLPNANGEIHEGVQREYFTIDGKNKLILSNKVIIFEINEYSSFDEHKQWLQSIIYEFMQKIRVPVVRTGIRYINKFQQSRIKLQKNYFAPEIAASLNPKIVKTEEEPCMIRSMHIIEYRIDDMTMNFRFGMYNPEYPSALKKNDFVLDYDFFSTDVYESADGVLHVLEKGHDEIQSLFEHSITDSLREVMESE